MTFTNDDILAKIQQLAGSKDFSTAESFLKARDVKPYDPAIGGKHSRERVMRRSDIIDTWRSRLQNSVAKGIKLYGCADFVRKLNDLSDNAGLLNVSFKGTSGTGLFWFMADSEEPIGFVIMKAHVKV